MKEIFRKVCVIGLGRIGLPTAATLAEAGYEVIGADVKQEIVDSVNTGNSYLKDEPGLQELVSKTVKMGLLKATTYVGNAIKSSDVIIVCVPTPVTEEKHADYSYIESAFGEISKNLRKGVMILVESTIGPGTLENVLIPILEKNGMKAGIDFLIASTPERADPGKTLEIFKKGTRIIGGINKESTDVATEFYSKVNKNIVQVSNPKTANAVKLTENIFRNTNIALVNELAILFEKLGIDTFEVIKASATKWNFIPHYPGAGVGGPCLPANPYYLIEEAIKVNYVPHLIRLANEINARMPEHVVELVSKALNKCDKAIKNSKITVLGLAYKPNIGDTQLSPAEKIISGLIKEGANIVAYDPFVKNYSRDIKIATNLEDAVKNSDCLIFVTNHDELKKIDFEKVKRLVNQPCAIVDGRGMFDPQDVIKMGFAYEGIGR